MVQLLTIVPDDWSIKKTVKFFNVTEHSVKMAQKLRKEQGILAVPKGYSREAEEETKVKGKEFFEKDDVSCLCPGKKDCVSVKLEDGRKEKVQKRLLLSNLKEIYQHIVTENPTVKVGFSTFAMIQPKWCVPGGSSGTHNVCVCTYHQNEKLMISCIDRSLDYKEL